MKKLMIVDDERPARELLKMMVNWEEAGFLPPLEARNGKEALALWEREHPDLVITDIQMPVMDGLELIRNLRAKAPEQTVAILSCHESFAYAREALRMGVMEYLVKDALTKETMYDLLRTVKTEGESGAGMSGTAEEGPPLNRERSRGPLALLQENGGSSPGVEAAMAARSPKGTEYFCCAVRPECPRRQLPQYVHRLKEALSSALMKAAGETHGPDDIQPGKDGCFLALVFVRSSVSAMEASNRRYAVIQALRAAAEALTGDKVTCGISGSRTDPRQLERTAREAEQALESRVFLGKGKTLYYDAAEGGMATVQTGLLERRISSVQTALSARDGQKLQAELEGLYEKDLAGIRQYNYLQHVNTLLLGVLTACCAAEGVLCRDIFGEDTVSSEALEALETVPELESWFLTRFKLLLSMLDCREKQEHSPRLVRILAYIDGHYCEDIGLDTVADEFHLNKIYLAKIFKTETGRSVNEYVRMHRVERAKTLLQDENNKISAIVSLVGYHNPQSFFSVFKRYVGVSPGEYRESLIK